LAADFINIGQLKKDMEGVLIKSNKHNSGCLGYFSQEKTVWYKPGIIT